MKDKIFKKLLDNIDLRNQRHYFENVTKLGNISHLINIEVEYKKYWLDCTFSIYGCRGLTTFTLESLEIISALAFTDTEEGDFETFLSEKRTEDLQKKLTQLIKDL